MTAPRRPAERCATCNSVEAAHSGTCKHPFKPAPPEAALTRVGAVTAHRDAEEIEHIADEGIAVAGIPANFRGTLVGMMVEAYRLRHDEIAALRAEVARLNEWCMGLMCLKESFLKQADEQHERADAAEAEVERLKRRENARAQVLEFDALKVRVATLEAAIRDAPHTPECVWENTAPQRSCDCWKSRALETEP